MVSVSLLAGPLHLTEETKRVGKGSMKSILGWQIRKRTNEWSLFVCLVKWHIMWLCVCERARGRERVCSSIWLWGSCPCREAQLKPGWHQSCVPVPWLTGCANRERTGRAEHMIMCLCWKCHLVPLSFQAKQHLGTWCESANIIFTVEERTSAKTREKRAFEKGFFFQFDLKHLMEQWKRLPFTL